MMEIKKVKVFPRGVGLDDRIEEADAAIRGAAIAWIVSVESVPLFLCGVWRLSLLGSGGRLFFHPFPAFYKHWRESALFLRRAMPRLKKACLNLTTLVREDEPRHARFVSFLGFTKTSSVVGDYRWYNFLR